MILAQNKYQSHGGIACDKVMLLAHNIGHQWGKIINMRHQSILIPQDGYDWDYFYLMRYSASVKEEVIEVDGVELFKAELSMIINNDQYFQRSTLAKSKCRKWHVKFDDADGTTKIMGGTKTDVCSMKLLSIDGGQMRRDHKHIKVMFTITSRRPICSYPF